MKKNDKKESVIKYWWEKSDEAIDSASREIKAKAYSYAMNRIYYAAFYAVSAALLDRNESFSKHSGVRAAFHRIFVKNGLIEKDFGKFYDRIFEDRQEGDYIEFISFEEEYVESQLKKCTEFLNKLRPLVSIFSDK